MCGRFLLTTPASDLAELLGLSTPPALVPRYNIAPTQTIGIVRARGVGPAREWAEVRWGLVPFWSEEPTTRAPLFNARADTAAAKPAFREPLHRRRCVVPADGFYEWKREGRARQPYLFRRRDGAPLVLAGLWERWSKGDAPPLESCTILTTSPNALVAAAHDRMPVVLAAEDFARWLDPALTSPGAVQDLLVPCAEDLLEALPVGPQVGNSRFDDPSCATPVPTGPALTTLR
jgi:putative SOS response-associated peptidase YedK